MTIFKTSPNRPPTGIRNKAMLYLGYRAGLRLSEVLALYSKDMKTDKGVMRVLHGKGDNARTVVLPPDACVDLDRWLYKRWVMKLSSRIPLFCTPDGKPLSDAYVKGADEKT